MKGQREMKEEEEEEDHSICAPQRSCGLRDTLTLLDIRYLSNCSPIPRLLSNGNTKLRNRFSHSRLKLPIRYKEIEQGFQNPLNCFSEKTNSPLPFTNKNGRFSFVVGFSICQRFSIFIPFENTPSL